MSGDVSRSNKGVPTFLLLAFGLGCQSLWRWLLFAEAVQVGRVLHFWVTCTACVVFPRPLRLVLDTRYGDLLHLVFLACAIWAHTLSAGHGTPSIPSAHFRLLHHDLFGTPWDGLQADDESSAESTGPCQSDEEEGRDVT